MKIATVDSACSILDRDFKPTNILSSVALVVDCPYDAPMRVEVRDGNYALSDPNVLVYELELCQQLLSRQEADCVHLDLTLGGVNLLDVTDEYLFQTQLSPAGRNYLHAVMPSLRGIATQIAETHHIPVLAMGKQSLPVRLAELHAAAYGIHHAFEQAKTVETPIYVGLPAQVKASFERHGIVQVSSADPMESILSAEATVAVDIPVTSFLNPVTRGFQVLRIGS